MASGKCAEMRETDIDLASVRAARRAGFRYGVRDISPLMVSLCAWGLVTGVAMTKAGLDWWAGLLMSMLVFAGSAQLTALPLLVVGAPVWLIFTAALIVNVRFVIFGAVAQPYFRRYPAMQRMLIGFVMTDATFVNFMAAYGEHKGDATHFQTWHLLGGGIVSWVLWQITSLAGLLLGAAIPTEWSLEFAGMLALLAILIPMCVTRPALFAVAVSGIVAWVCQPLPLRMGLLVSVIAGVLAGYWAEKRMDRSALISDRKADPS